MGTIGPSDTAAYTRACLNNIVRTNCRKRVPSSASCCGVALSRPGDFAWTQQREPGGLRNDDETPTCLTSGTPREKRKGSTEQQPGQGLFVRAGWDWPRSRPAQPLPVATLPDREFKVGQEWQNDSTLARTELDGGLCRGGTAGDASFLLSQASEAARKGHGGGYRDVRADRNYLRQRLC